MTKDVLPPGWALTTLDLPEGRLTELDEVLAACSWLRMDHGARGVG